MLTKGWKYIPYQHVYWWLIGPPIVTTGLFMLQNLYFVFTQRKWSDLFFMLTFFARYFFCYLMFLNVSDCVLLYFCFRFWESHWFTWVTSMSHLPRGIRTEHKNHNWVALHTIATQNITSGFFHDWFTGHLNHQIEHHLFPSMPRHQLPKVAPLVKALCAKYQCPYNVRTMYECCCDIMNTLNQVGRAWEKQLSFKMD